MAVVKVNEAYVHGAVTLVRSGDSYIPYIDGRVLEEAFKMVGLTGSYEAINALVMDAKQALLDYKLGQRP